MGNEIDPPLSLPFESRCVCVTNWNDPRVHYSLFVTTTRAVVVEWGGWRSLHFSKNEVVSTRCCIIEHKPTTSLGSNGN
jgi:hypothetical protein